MPLTKIQSLGITDGTIVNADINASAAIASTKLSGISSDYVRLATSTISANTTAVTFDGYFSSTYDTYIVFGSNIYTDGNAYFKLNLRQSSANLSGNDYYYGGTDSNSSAGTQAYATAGGNHVQMNRVTTHASANYSNHFEITLSDANNNNGSHFPIYAINTYYLRNDGASGISLISGFYTGVTTAISGFQITPSTGNFDTGTIVLYGVKKS
jgi:hypothetical protein